MPNGGSDHKRRSLETSLSRARLDWNGQKVKLPEPVTWEQLEPALPSAESAARTRAVDMGQGVLQG